MTDTKEVKKDEKAEARKAAIAAYYDAKTPAERAELLKKHAFLNELFSTGNHS